MNVIWLFIIVCIVSLGLTKLFYRYAIMKNLVDVPNERSSHSCPTPRGGGVSIVVSFLLGLMLLWVASFISSDVFIGFFVSGGATAITGFVDDHGHIPARWRLLGHFSAASWLVFWLGGFPPLVMFGVSVDIGWLGDISVIIALVWLLNLYNFMDGIDGIAGIEALSSTLVSALIFLIIFNNQAMFSLSMLMFVSVVGFLIWNFPPAKIFMGDAGSGFLGLTLGAIALHSLHTNFVMMWVWLIMLGIFIVDATYTLLRRLLRGDKVYEAHCSHAYQHASRKHSSHLLVTLAVLAINLCWLAPLSYVVAIGLIDGFVGLLCAYVPLIGLAIYYHAGELTQQKVNN